jgi:hypothetical protein
MDFILFPYYLSLTAMTGRPYQLSLSLHLTERVPPVPTADAPSISGGPLPHHPQTMFFLHLPKPYLRLPSSMSHHQEISTEPMPSPLP